MADATNGRYDTINGDRHRLAAERMSVATILEAETRDRLRAELSPATIDSESRTALGSKATQGTRLFWDEIRVATGQIGIAYDA